MLLKRALPCSHAQGRQKRAGEEKCRKAVTGSWRLPAPAAPGPPSSALHRWLSSVSMFRCPTAHFATFRAISALFLLPAVITEELQQGSSDSPHTLSAAVKGRLPGSWPQKRQVQTNQTSDTYGRLVWGVSFGHTIRFATSDLLIAPISC